MPSKYGASYDSVKLYESNIDRLMDHDVIDSQKCELVDQMIDAMIIARNNDVDIIDDIQDLKVLKVAADYLLLSLIYTQLGTTGLNQVWVAKRNSYWNLYQY